MRIRWTYKVARFSVLGRSDRTTLSSLCSHCRLLRNFLIRGCIESPGARVAKSGKAEILSREAKSFYETNRQEMIS